MTLTASAQIAMGLPKRLMSVVGRFNGLWLLADSPSPRGTMDILATR